MLALPADLRASGKQRGRPALEEPRNCVAFTRLTTAEYNALVGLMPPRGSLSDFVRDLLSEAVVARLAAHERAGRSAQISASA